MSSNPQQPSPATGSNYPQQTLKQSSPGTGANYFQQPGQRGTQQGFPASGPNYFQQTSHESIQSGTPMTGSSYSQQPQGSNTQQRSSATGPNYFQQTPQRGPQQGSLTLPKYFQQPQRISTQQRAAVRNANYFSHTQQRNAPQDFFTEEQAFVAPIGSNRRMDNIDPSLQGLFQPEPQASPQTTQPYQQPQRHVQGYPLSTSQYIHQHAPVANMGYSPPQQPRPRDLLSRYPYLQQCRSKCSPGPYQSPYSPQGGFTEPYLPLKLNPLSQQQEQQQVLLQPSEQGQSITDQGQADQAGQEQRGQKRDFESFCADMRGAASNDTSSPERTLDRLEELMLAGIARDALETGESGFGGGMFDGQG